MPEYKIFALDEFIFGNAPKCRTTLHNSCVDPLSLAELQKYNVSRSILPDSLALSYGPTKGIPELRQNISSLYQTSHVTEDDVLVTAGAIHANFLVLDTLVEPGDHVVVQHPTYLQLIEIPRRAGAEVSLWKWHYNATSDSWNMDLSELEAMIKPHTKMIVLSTPNNPIGSIMGRNELENIVHLARKCNIVIMCDEVFRFLHHDQGVEQTPSLLELEYEKSIVTGSVSKAFALPGIRLGWIATSSGMNDALHRISHTRDYTTITVSQVDQNIAAFALSENVRREILERSRSICGKNITILKQWATEHAQWARISEPRGGGTILLKVLGKDGLPINDIDFALALIKKENVCVPPAGHCFGDLADGSGQTDLRGYLRVGIVSDPTDLEIGLKAIASLRAEWG